MTLAELRQTCQIFQLPQNGITPTLRTRLRNYLLAHKHEMQHDYDYAALYPNRDPLPNRGQPRDEMLDSHTHSEWNGIGHQRSALGAPSIRAASVAVTADNRVEEYLQSKSLPHLPFSSSRSLP